MTTTRISHPFDTQDLPKGSYFTADPNYPGKVAFFFASGECVGDFIEPDYPAKVIAEHEAAEAAGDLIVPRWFDQ